MHSPPQTEWEKPLDSLLNPPSPRVSAPPVLVKVADNMKDISVIFKGIVHNFFFYRSNLIFWIVMGCGIADLGRRGL